MKTPLHKLVRSTLAAALLLVSSAAMAQESHKYPERPITLVVGLSPGASSDSVAREVAKQLSSRLNVPVLVDNKPGANTIIASNTVAKAKPDGYTLLLTNSMNTTNPSVQKSLPYDYRKDHEHIVMLASAPNLMGVRSTLTEVKDIAGLVAYAKKNPGKFTYGSAGVGSIHHLLMEVIAERAGIRLNHVPYKGGGNAIQDLLGNNIDSYFGTISSLQQHVKTGAVTPLFVTSATRSNKMPNTETLEEYGLKGLVSDYWLGLSGPAGMPKEVVTRLNKEVNEILKDPEVIKRFDELGVIPLGGTPKDMEDLFNHELQFWKAAAQAAGVIPS
ncbi:MAG: tripartite tricarboxylate transporter substrate binding protein [Alcaligenaceae bacterium]|nr:tripartite tricarboxylate transporter substrate binding protein [Alcaligenaceae bacterium]